MKKPHYAWAICLACVWLYLSNIGLCSNVLTVYLPFIEAGGLSDSAGSAILSVRCLFSFFATFFVGVYYQKLSLRTGILVASLMGAAAPVLFCMGDGAATYYIGAALAGTAYGLGCIYPASLLLTNWFCVHRGLAVGISSAGSGVSTMLFSPLLTGLVLKLSLKAAFLTQSAIMVVGAVVSFLIIRDTPKEKHTDPYGGKIEKADENVAVIFHERAPCGRGMLAAMMLLNGGAGLAFSGHLSVLIISCGYGAEMAAAAVSVFGLILVLGKLVSGGFADLVGSKKCSMVLICAFIAGCLFVIGMNGGNGFVCFASAGFLGFGASVFNVGPPLWAADLSPRSGYAKTLKWLQLFYNLGGIVFTIVPGFIADHTGEYKSSYYMFAAMMLASMLILLRAYAKSGMKKGQFSRENSRENCPKRWGI